MSLSSSVQPILLQTFVSARIINYNHLLAMGVGEAAEPSN